MGRPGLCCGCTGQRCSGAVDAGGVADGEMGEAPLVISGVSMYAMIRNEAPHTTACDVDVEDAFEPLHPAHGRRGLRTGLASVAQGQRGGR